MTHTHIPRPRIPLTRCRHVVVNSPRWTRLTQVGSRVPKRVLLVAIDLNALVQLKTKSKLLRAHPIRLYAFLVIVVPFFVKRTCFDALLVSVRPLGVRWACLALARFLVERWGGGRALETFEIYWVPVWSGGRAHWGCSSLLAWSCLGVVELVWSACPVLALCCALLRQLIENLIFCAISTDFLYWVIERFLISAFITGKRNLIPKRPFRRTQRVSISVLSNTPFRSSIEVIPISTDLWWRFASPRVLVPCFVGITFPAAFEDNIKIGSLRWAWLTWVA